MHLLHQQMHARVRDATSVIRETETFETLAFQLGPLSRFRTAKVTLTNQNRRVQKG